jgi:hypothetical protein
MIPLTFADESDTYSTEVEIDSKTQQESEIMHDGLGAEIRLLQLEKAIIENINKGNEIISILNETDMNITDLQLVIEEFKLLKSDVQLADPTASDAVSIFVDLKHDAVNLSTDFRETVRGLLNNTLTDQIRQLTRNMTCNQTQVISNSIQNKIRQYNSNQFRKIYQGLGENSSEFIRRYQNGSMTQNQVKRNITSRFNQTERGNRFIFFSSLKQQKIKNKIESQNQIQNASEGFQQRQENRFMKRLQEIEDFPDNPLYNQLMKRLQNKIDDIGGNGNNGSSGNGSNNGGDDDSGSGQKKSGSGENGKSNGAGGGR